jgi:hypothetical protein
MQVWDFGLTVDISDVRIMCTGNKDDKKVSNKLMFNFGIAKQSL